MLIPAAPHPPHGIAPPDDAQPVGSVPSVPPPIKPVVLTFGNCQAQLITWLMRLCPLLGEHFQFEAMADFEDTLEAEPVTPETLAKVSVVWEQVAQGEPSDLRRAMREAVPPGCRTIRFPPLDLVCLWPFTGSDARQRPELPRYPYGRYPYPDWVAAELAGSDLPDEALVELYMRRTRENLPDLERFWDLDRYRLKVRDGLSDVQIGPWVEETVRTQQLLYSLDHISGIPTAHIAKLLVAATPDMDGLSEFVDREIEAAVIENAFDGHDELRLPVHPAVAEALELGWYHPQMRYRWQDQAWTHDEYIVNYIRWTAW